MTKPKKNYIQAGLMRCCILTLSDAVVEEKDNEILKCKYCDSEMIFTGLYWEWKHPQREGKTI